MATDQGLNAALDAVAAARATDLVFTVGNPPMMRVDGAIRPIEGAAALDAAQVNACLCELLDDNQIAAMDRDRDVDFAYSHGPHRFRGNAFFQRGRPAVALRLIQETIPTFDEIGLPPAVRELIDRKQGLILFCGPTGSGKSTSMASLVDAINASRACHIITIEDPIEYLHENKTAVVHQREVGIDAQSFARALRAALREDPDVVLVGEMRDPESIAITLTLAETGHLVLSSLHTNDAPQTLDRIVDVFPGDRQAQIRTQLASTLSAVVAQRLVPRIGGGQVAAYEVLLATSAVSNLVREGKTRQLRNAMQMALGAGHKTIEMSLNELVGWGIITKETAVAHAFVPHEVDTSLPAPLAAQG
ncbi:MAG TPA: PilT/PilU family type 4a pilus ATPase [Acidimicrobiia bacterium]|nr:PilT/PilU family type 4a pilus ATPase [Acidimicrobiia bacterium]